MYCGQCTRLYSIAKPAGYVFYQLYPYPRSGERFGIFPSKGGSFKKMKGNSVPGNLSVELFDFY
jgi:hypothetical protein